MTRPTGQLAPTWLVRVIATALLCVGAFLAYVAATNYEAIGAWWALLAGLSGVTTMCFSAVALWTGQAEWILLDIILPG